MKLKTLPPSALDKLVTAGKPIYVLNTSRTPSGDKGAIMVNIFDGTRREFLKIPPTFIPFAATDAIEGSKLRSCSDFRQCLAKGMLTLVDPDQAERYLESPEARQEWEALNLSEHSMRTRRIDVEAEVAKRSRVIHNSTSEESASAGPLDHHQDVSAIDTVTNRIYGLVEDMNSGNKTSDQVLIELRRHQSALTAVDISYVMANTTDGKIKEWAKSALKDEGGVKVTPVTAQAKKKAPTAAKKASESGSTAFDFSEAKSDDMSPEEQRSYAEARSKAAATQALNGESKAAELIDSLLKTK